MKLIRLLVLLALATPAFSQVEDGQWFKAGFKHGMFQVHVSENGIGGNVLVSVTPQGGVQSQAVPGVPGPDPNTCVQSAPIPASTTSIKVDNGGSVYYQNDSGDWINCGAPRNPPKMWPALHYHRSGSGASLPQVEYEWDWTTSPYTSMNDDWLPAPPRRKDTLSLEVWSVA